MSDDLDAASLDDLVEILREHWLTDDDLAFVRAIERPALVRLVREVRAHARRVHADQRSLYAALAATTRLIPNMLVAKLSAGLSPYVLAQVAEHLEAKAAAGLTKIFEPHVLGEIVLHIDAHTAARIAPHMDLGMLLRIVDTLAGKGLTKRLSEIADALDEAMLDKLVQKIEDPARIAAVASHMQQLDKLASVARRLDAGRVAKVSAHLERAGHAAALAAIRR